MADKTIPQLTDAALPLLGSETTTIVQNGNSRECSVQDIADLKPTGETGYLHIVVARSNLDFANTLDSTTYTFNNFLLQFPIDLASFPFTHYRLILRGSANEAGQTVFCQIDSSINGSAPCGSGDDITVTDTASNFDSGWKQRTDGLTGFQFYNLLVKGSNATVDLLIRRADVLLKIQ